METLDREWTMAEMSVSAGVSASQLRRDFAAAMGVSPMRYLKQLRMTTARDLLVNTDQPVKHVAFAVGLTDLSHFVRDFRDFHGCSPSAVRASRDVPSMRAFANK
jgi:AraC family transcriptional regulator